MPADRAPLDRSLVRVGVFSSQSETAHRWKALLHAQGYAQTVAFSSPDTPPVAWDAVLIHCPPGGESLLELFSTSTPIPVRFALIEAEDLRLVERCFSLGADDVFSQSLNAEILGERLARHLRDRAALVELSEVHERTHRHFLNIVKVMVKVLETKDEYTKFHSDNVARYSRMIAARVGMDRDAVYKAGLAGILHDFGKIGVAEKILNKPSRLTEQEFAIIKRHPSIGSLILETISGLEGVIPGIKYHHERWDGRGYPDGLKGEEIPLMGRIVGLADAYDTLTSDRTYHRRLPQDVAVAEIRRCAGTQFDPALVTAFVDILTAPGG